MTALVEKVGGMLGAGTGASVCSGANSGAADEVPA
jgi:hypothetical protein